MDSEGGSVRVSYFFWGGVRIPSLLLVVLCDVGKVTRHR